MAKTRTLTFAVTILLLASSLFSYVFYENNFLIRKWRIPMDPPGYRDAQQIGIAAESYAQGNDPLKENLFNNKGYQGLNYPRIWHILFAIGINQSHTKLIGSIFAILFFTGVGLFWYSRNFGSLAYIIMTVVTLSPIVMLGIERGNIEVVVFFVLGAALFVNYYSNLTAFFLFLFSSFLKLYPVFAFIVFIKEQKRNFLLLFIPACVIFITYVLFTFDDLKQIYLIQPQNAKSSYGISVFWKGLMHPRIFNLQLSGDSIMIFKILSYVLFGFIFFTALTLSSKAYKTNRFTHGDYIDSFRTGAGIYIGCFLLGSNYDYRLIFLIFTIPQLISWLRINDKKISKIPLITLAAIIFSCWSYVPERIIGIKLNFVLEETCNWVILSCLLYLLLTSVPDWIHTYLNKPFDLIKRANESI